MKEIVTEYIEKLKTDKDCQLSFKLARNKKIIETLYENKEAKNLIYTNLKNYQEEYGNLPDNESVYKTQQRKYFNYENCNHPELNYLKEIQEKIAKRIAILSKELESKIEAVDPLKANKEDSKMTLDGITVKMIKEYDYIFEEIENGEEFIEVILPQKFTKTIEMITIKK
jgi:hypothetical protein